MSVGVGVEVGAGEGVSVGVGVALCVWVRGTAGVVVVRTVVVGVVVSDATTVVSWKAGCDDGAA